MSEKVFSCVTCWQEVLAAPQFGPRLVRLQLFTQTCIVLQELLFFFVPSCYIFIKVNSGVGSSCRLSLYCCSILEKKRKEKKKKKGGKKNDVLCVTVMSRLRAGRSSQRGELQPSPAAFAAASSARRGGLRRQSSSCSVCLDANLGRTMDACPSR